MGKGEQILKGLNLNKDLNKDTTIIWVINKIGGKKTTSLVKTKLLMHHMSFKSFKTTLKGLIIKLICQVEIIKEIICQ